MKFLILGYFIILFAGAQGQDEDLLVDTGAFGRIRGRFGTTVKGRQIVEFLSIPYAPKPERFMPSIRLDSVTDNGEIFDAVRHGPKCTQPVIGDGMSEDCLTLSVYTPQIKKSEDQELLPILVWVHGGTFISGSGIEFNGARLLDRDILLVSINYRVGLLGLFGLGIDEAPGNNSLEDILNALRWIQDYISYFGGDPTRVTLSGQSSGSALVTHLLLSPSATGLIHGVIAQSGSALNEWATTKTIDGGIRVAQFVGCSNGDLGAIATCMKGKTTVTIQLAMLRYFLEEQLRGRLGFEMVNPYVQAGGVVPDDPVRVLEEGRQNRIPLMGGATRHDGSGILQTLVDMFLTPNGLLDDEEFLKWEIVPTIMKALSIENKHGYHQMIENLYLKETKMSGNFTLMIHELIDICNGFFYKSGVHRLAQMHSRWVNSTYFYSFDYNWRKYTQPQVYSKGIWNAEFGFDSRANIPEGVGHSAELEYLFKRRDLNEEDQKISDLLTNYWKNFISYGNPNGDTDEYPHWPSFSEKTPQFIFIDRETRVEENYVAHWPGVSKELVEEIPDATEPSPSGEEKCDDKSDIISVWRTLFVVFAALFLVTAAISIYYIRKLKRK